MRAETDYVKWTILSRLGRGDKVRIRSGEIVEFQSLKQKNFTAKKSDGTLWNLDVNGFMELVEKATTIDKTSDIPTLKSGELFYILHKDQVMLFKFEFLKGNKIHAKNPVTNGKATMDVAMYSGRVSEL